MWKTSTTILLFLCSSFLMAQGTDFFTGTWKEAIAKAKKEDKIIFVDAYTSWCGPCRRLKKEVFPKKEVGDFLRKDFIPLAIDLESSRGLLFSLYYKIKGYPSFLFIDNKGQIIHRTLGFRNPKQLMRDGNLAIERYRMAADLLLSKWDERKRDVAYTKNYIFILKLAGKPIAPLVFEYLEASELSELEKTIFIFEQLGEVSGPLMDKLLKKNQISNLIDTLGKPAIEEKIISLCMQDIDATYDNNQRKQRKNLKKRIKSIPFFTKNHFDTYNDYRSNLKKGKYKKTKEAAINYFALLPTDQLKRSFLIQLFDQQIDGKYLNSTVIQLAQKMYGTANTPENDILYVELLVLNKQYEKATELMNQVMEKAIDNKDQPTQIELRRFNKFLQKK